MYVPYEKENFVFLTSSLISSRGQSSGTFHQSQRMFSLPIGGKIIGECETIVELRAVGIKETGFIFISRHGRALESGPTRSVEHLHRLGQVSSAALYFTVLPLCFEDRISFLIGTCTLLCSSKRDLENIYDTPIILYVPLENLSQDQKCQLLDDEEEDVLG